MNPKIKIVGITLALSLFVLSACTARTAQPASATATPNAANIANPASAYCREQGNRSEIRTATNGSQSGVCVFAAGSECDEWAYFRGECAAGSRGKDVEIVRSKLASQLKVQASTIELVSVEATTWPDACLGVPQDGETCARVVTPGFRITLSTSGKSYIYHTNLSASVIR
jgi:putative hemolysin